MAGSFIVKDGNNNEIVGALSFEAGGALVKFTPSSPLVSAMGHTVTVTTGCKDTNGVPLAADFVLHFTTANAGSPPVVITTIPSDGATDINPAEPVQIQFDRPMDAATITNS